MKEHVRRDGWNEQPFDPEVLNQRAWAPSADLAPKLGFDLEHISSLFGLLKL